jgi:ADP-heptose:LPS heptosyltransferase
LRVSPTSASPRPEGAVQLRLPAAARVLVVKTAGIGDLLLAVPALRSLRTAYPDATIDLLTTPGAAPLLRGSPLINRLLLVDKVAFDHPRDVLRAPWRAAGLVALGTWLRAHRYDAVVLMHHLTLPFGRAKYRALLWATGAPIRVGLDNGYGSFLSVRVADEGFGARHEAQYMLDLVAALGAPPSPMVCGASLADLGWNAAHDAPSDTTLTDAARPLVALHPGSGSYSVARRWPLERWVELAQALHAECGASIALIGGPDERDVAEQCAARLGAVSWVQLLPAQIGLRALAVALAQCDLLVGNDSLPAHLAAAAGTPVVAVFGPSNHRAWAPLPSREDAFVAVVRQELPCSPCFYVGHGLGTPQGCAARTCLTTLPTAAVLSQACAALATRRTRSAAPRSDAGSAA